MTDLVNDLRKQRDSYAVRLSNLLLEFEKNPDMLFLVFEGEDIKYYGVRITSVFGEAERMTIPCKGKNDVIRLYFRILDDEQLSAIKIMYFVDRDFDDNSLIDRHENIYITCMYSIESFYVMHRCLNDIITSEFSLCAFENGVALEKIVNLYQQRMKEFLEAITLISAWIMEQRAVEGQQRKLNLNNVNVERLISVSLDSVTARYVYEDLKVLFPEAGEVDEDRVRARVIGMEGNDKLSLFRGKHLIEFLRLFLQALKNDKSSLSPKYFPQRGGVKIQLSRTNILSELSQYATTPQCLNEFLSNCYQRFGFRLKVQSQVL